MQTLSRTMEEAIRGSYQVPIAKLEIYNQNGSLAGTINDVETVEVNVAESRKVLRTFQAQINNDDGQYTPDPDQYDRNFLWYNKTAKVFYGYVTTSGNEYLPQGVFTIDYIKPHVSPEGISLEIGGQDLSSKMIEDKFDDTYTVTDNPTESNNYALASLGASASATSYVQAADEIQTQARIHYIDTFATISGLETKVENESTTPLNNLINQNMGSMWSYKYTPKTGETISKIEAEIFVDLQSAENLNGFDIQLSDGAALTDFVYTSPDNAAWTSYTTPYVVPTGKVRYIKFKVRKTAANADGSWSLAVSEIQIRTADNFSPGLAIDGDYYVSHWKPKALASDPDPKLTINFGAAKTINVLYLYWGNDSFDFWNRVKYYLEYSSNGSTWTRITDLNGLDESDSLFGDVEHCFNAISCQYIRINIKDRDGIPKLRHIKAQNISATDTIDKVIKDVATSSGITNTRIPVTRRYVEKKQAEIGDEKIHFCNLLAGSISWVDLYMDENGVLCTGPRNINPVDLAWTFDVGTDNIFSFSPRFSNDIYNVIVVVGKSSSSKAIVGKAEDNDPLSPTYTGTLGRRVKKYEGDSYNTQDKADQYAQQKLFERTRFKHQTSLPVTGHPGLQHDDVVKVNVPEAKVEDQLYMVTGFVTRFNAANAEFDTTMNISQL